MPKRTPIQVYLDNSDFSHFSEPNLSSARNLLFDELKKLVVKGKIQIRYSGITILESIHQNIAHKGFAIARAHVINELCQGHTLPLYTELQALECHNFIHGSTISRSSIFKEDNQWLLNSKEFAHEISDQIWVELQDAIGAKSRQDRRRLQKELFKNGILRQKYQPAIENRSKSTSDALVEKYPILEALPLDNEIKGLLFGKISQAAFVQQLSNKFFSPVPFTEHLYDFYCSQPDSQQDPLRSFGITIYKMIELFRAEISKIIDLATLFEKPEREVKILISQKLNSKTGWLERRNKILEAMYFQRVTHGLNISENEAKKMLLKSLPGTLPAFDIALRLSWDLAFRKAADSQTKLATSDGGDILHANYLPYVDIFRADKRTSPLLQSICDEYGIKTKLAKSIEDVLDFV